jgi:putative tricarboxylic transport membrane protein
VAKSDRIFGVVVLVVALAYIASATQIESSFLSDPVGPKTFPIGIGLVAALSAVVMIVRPDEDPQWPALRNFGALVVAAIVLVAYALLLKPLGFLLPTAIAATILSYQLSPRAVPAMLAGIGLSIGLFLIFKYALGLGLVAFPKGVF